MRYFSAIIIAFCFAVSGCLSFNFSGTTGDGKVALIEIKGTIIEPDQVVEDLEKALDLNKIKAIVVRVDSPGGSVGASQEIFRTIKNIDKKKPVVISMGDVAASGGYYVAAGGRKIFANEGTITGSIGVRMEHVNLGRLLDWMKLEPQTLKSGRYKDIGSAYRPLTEEEKKILEELLVELHVQFKKDITESRHLEAAFIDSIADGRVYTGLKAKEMGLVDEIGGVIEARREAMKLAGYEGDTEFVKMKKEKPWWREIFTEELTDVAKNISAIGGEKFLYKWDPVGDR